MCIFTLTHTHTHTHTHTTDSGNKLRIRRRTSRVSPAKPVGMILLLSMLVFVITKCS